MAFATLTDLETRIGRDLDPIEAAQATVMLEEATDLIKALTGQQILQATSIATFSGYRRLIVLPQIPVTAVSVTTEGRVYGTYEYDWVAEGLLTHRGYGWARSVVVTYTHGYVTVPPALVRLTTKLTGDALALAARPANVTSERIGDYAVSMDTAASMLTVDDYRILESYKQVYAP